MTEIQNVLREAREQVNYYRKSPGVNGVSDKIVFGNNNSIREKNNLDQKLEIMKSIKEQQLLNQNHDGGEKEDEDDEGEESVDFYE